MCGVVGALFFLLPFTSGGVLSAVRFLGSHVAERVIAWPTNSELMRRNEDLAHQVAQLHNKVAQLQQLKSENDALRAFASLGEARSENILSAPVVGRSPVATFSSYYILFRGSRDGVNVGNAIINSDGVVVGKISEVFPDRSYAVSLTSTRTKIAVALAHAPEGTGLVTGDVNTGLIVSMIPQGVALSVGDAVITSGVEDRIPAGLLVGTVAQVTSQDKDPFQTAYISSAGSLASNRMVGIVLY